MSRQRSSLLGCPRATPVAMKQTKAHNVFTGMRCEAIRLPLRNFGQDAEWRQTGECLVCDRVLKGKRLTLRNSSAQILSQHFVVRHEQALDDLTITYRLGFGRFFTNSQITKEINPKINVATAHSRGPIVPHFVMAKVIVGSGIRYKKAERIKNMIALMRNEAGLITVPPGPGISLLFLSRCFC